jgi:hypothetical protein
MEGKDDARRVKIRQRMIIWSGRRSLRAEASAKEVRSCGRASMLSGRTRSMRAKKPKDIVKARYLMRKVGRLARLEFKVARKEARPMGKFIHPKSSQREANAWHSSFGWTHRPGPIADIDMAHLMKIPTPYPL